MLVYPVVRQWARFSGGELEKRVIYKAHQVMIDGRSRYLEYDMTDPSRSDPGVCGGHMDVFVDLFNNDGWISQSFSKFLS